MNENFNGQNSDPNAKDGGFVYQGNPYSDLPPSAYQPQQPQYQQPYQAPYYQTPKKSAFTCAVTGFVFGLLSFLGYFTFNILLVAASSNQTVNDFLNTSPLFTLFSLLFSFIMPVGPIVSLVLGIVSVCLSGKPMQLNGQKAKRFGIADICLFCR